jgi:hypothetical protein
MVHNKIQCFFIKKHCFVFVVIAAICLYTITTKRFKGDSWKVCIQSDGYGYYGYLPCIFILHHFDYRQIISNEESIWHESKMHYPQPPFIIDGKTQFDKCYVGVAVLLTPFFLLAYFLSLLLHQDMMGGYSIFFQESVSIASLFYMMLGLVFMRKLLKEYQVSELVIGFTLLVTVFGTNLFYYTTMEQSMSHQYSFGVMGMFLFHSRKSLTDLKLKYFIWMAVALALLALIRPTNVICILIIPFLAAGYEPLKSFFVKIFNPKNLAILFCITVTIYSIQNIVWYFETDSLFVWSYVGEGFNFAHPHFIDILFSYRKGLFVYTPLILVSLLGGLVYLYQQNKFSFWAFLLFFLVVTYILSSWGCWYFGGSYGLRAYIDFFPIFMLGFAFFLNSSRSILLKIIFITAALLSTALNLLQTYQYTHWILPYDETDKNLYWRIFLKTDATKIPGLVPFPDSTVLSFYPQLHYSNGFESIEPLWHNNNNITASTAHSGKFSAFVCHDSSYTAALFLPVDSLPKERNINVFVTAWAKMNDRKGDPAIVVSVETKDRKSYFWQSRPLMNYIFNLGEWQRAGFIAELPELKNPDDNIVIYVYATTGMTYIDDLDVKFGKLKTAN